MRTYRVPRNWFRKRNSLDKYLVLLDAGHGGLVNGKYVTPGKRSPEWKDGYQYFEGVGNRERRDYMAKMLTKSGIRFEYVNEGNDDMPLHKRTEIVNSLAKENGVKNTLCFSIHSNGHSNNRAEGYEVYTSQNETDSDICASFVFSNMKEAYPKRKMRMDMSDGDPDKEANFWMLTKTICPSVLTEDFFHTNEYECNQILRSPEHQKAIANCHARAIVSYFEYLNYKNNK